MKKFLLLTAIIFLFTSGSKAESKTDGIDSTIAFYISKVEPDSIQAYMQALEDMGTRFCLAENRRDVAVWIMNKFIELGYPDTYLDSFPFNRTYQNVYYETWQYNVVSTLPGYSRPDEIYILGGHHDAIVPFSSNPFVIAPGADDNASGVAAALEVARVMKQYNYVPEGSVRFITFAAEEFGLHGSWRYAGIASAQNMNIKMMINNDMISHVNSPPAAWAIKLFKYPNAQWVSSLAAYVVQKFTDLTAYEFTHSSANTDSWPFFHYGYPAIFLHEYEFCPFYHSVNDVVANTNKYYAAEMIKVSLGMLIHENGVGLNTSVPEVEKLSLAKLHPNYPNPFSGHTTIKYSLYEPGRVRLEVYDVANRLAAVLYNGWQEAGSHNINFDASAMPAGIYFCHLQTAAQTSVIKMVVMGK